VLPFSVELKPGLPVSKQVVFAVKRAIVGGRLSPGTPFPSVRQLSEELRINPNTAHKIIATLTQEGVLLTTPAVGSVVAVPTLGARRDRAALLGETLERLTVEAKQLGLDLPSVEAALRAHWEKISYDNSSFR
jgi:GntR family transcriptional regulator